MPNFLAAERWQVIAPGVSVGICGVYRSKPWKGGTIGELSIVSPLSGLAKLLVQIPRAYALGYYLPSLSGLKRRNFITRERGNGRESLAYAARSVTTNSFSAVSCDLGSGAGLLKKMFLQVFLGCPELFANSR